MTLPRKVFGKEYYGRGKPSWNLLEEVRKDTEIVFSLLLTPFYFILLSSALPRHLRKARWKPQLRASYGKPHSSRM